jgi:hypothetical protein
MSATESLAARAEAMLNRLVQAKAEAASQQTRNEIEAARTRASRVMVDLSAARDTASGLAEYGVAVNLATPDAVLQDVIRARTALRRAANSMVGAEPDAVVGRVKSQSVDAALTTAEKLAKSTLAGLIRSVERRRQEVLPAEIGERIMAYPGTSDLLVARLSGIQRRLQQKVENLTAEKLVQRAQQITEDAAAWAQEWPQLETSLHGRHPDVQEFLRQAATDEGASWELITPAVAEWLTDPENTASLRVVLR